MTELDEWSTIGAQRAFQNKWLAVDLEQVALPDGSRYEYTRIVPGRVGVGVIGFNRAGEVLLEREYRHGVRKVIWQIPGGLADAGEDLQAAGLRELLEETGYQPEEVSASTVRYLGTVWDNPALGPGESHILAVRDLELVATPKRNAAEYVSLHWQSLEWLQEAIRSGEIRDRVVIAAALQLMLHGLLGGW